jgi:type IV secretion system protein VirB10
MEEVLNNSQSATAQTGVHVEPELRRSGNEPNGVLRKDLKPMIYLGAATVVILAAVFSGVGKKSPATHAAANHEPPQPAVQDNTDNNVQTLKSNVAAARQRDQQLGSTLANSNNYPASASSVPAQQSASGYGPYGNSEPCLAGQPCAQGQSGSGGAGNGQSQLTPEQQEAQQIAAKERQRADESRFASNLVFARATEQPQQQPPAQLVPANYGASGQRTEESALVPPRAAGEQQETPGGYKRPLEANLDSATGPPYLVYEGSVLDTVLVNRLDGDAPGPVKVLVSNPLYSHDHQHVIIPEGTVVLGEVKKIGTSGFGQQRRLTMYQNRITLIGFLGQDAVTRTANNASFTVLSLATKSSYKDKKTGEYNGHTEWHRCIVWGRLSEYAKTLTKGAHLAVEGELRSRETTDKKTNARLRVWEVRVSSILKLDRAEKVSPEEQENADFNPEEEAA